ncbi:MAG TPA: glycosyltransferase family 4 protein [Planctomycetaceae bacterium]|jgi:GalNAc-alpha-(1->4)-GalNAc-alpha-(1->3)-diNAcBac-PP-undecaprenol alpha-1,4-N-acetyl-D-galactosaminyltransferase|nr:glycosyltransferase family 4 protein [Planctomycetaceae bacterium]HCK53039.1 glycosyltransferase family 4 protein [Planctomycetaceae bacterium]|tara:strand:- start:2535 stop:3704 length:1170 start_codon:yes stop_codon:yes gene_type:complete
MSIGDDGVPLKLSRRLTLVIHSLAQGGAERDMAHLARCWTERGHDVAVVTLDSVAADSYPLAEGVTRIGLGLAGDSHGWLQAISNNRQRIRALHDVLCQRSPQTVVSFIDRMNVLTLKAATGLTDPVIVSERIDPRHHEPGRIWRWLRRRTYPLCTAQVVLTHSVRDWCRQLAPRQPVHVIPNPARRPETGSTNVAPEWAPAGRTVLLGIGRLHPQKGFDRLLPIFQRLRSSHPDWHLVLLGEGDERIRLEAQVQDLGLQQHVSLPGWVADVEGALSRSDLFVLPSRYEGFGNVVAEALACGVPVVTMDCPSGPGEIVRDGVDGFIVPADDTARLEQVLDQVMGDAQLRDQFSARGPEVLDRFSEQKFLAQWDAVLEGNSESEVDAILA